MMPIELIGKEAKQFRPTVYWYLSFRCNLECVHCWVNSSPHVDTSTDLDEEGALTTAKKIASFNPTAVTLSGGEPLLRRDAPVIISTLLDDGVNDLRIETNGMLARPAVMKPLVEANERGVHIVIAGSLDGGTAAAHQAMRGEGTFEIALRGYRRFLDAGLWTELQCVVTRFNIHSIPALLDVALELGINRLKFVFVNPVGRAADHFDDLSIPHREYGAALEFLADSAEAYPSLLRVKSPPAAIPPHLLTRLTSLAAQREAFSGCGFPLLGVLPDGSVTICGLTRDNADLRLGHILEDELADLWRKGQGARLREMYMRAELTGICGDCVFRTSCKGACRAHAFGEGDSWSAPYPMCADLEREGLFPNVYRASFFRRINPETAPIPSSRDA
ncbi:MAG: radical SAM protein [Thermaerobacter sp.]|nr:radical SAM protein [Thermaerobacter sp.]